MNINRSVWSSEYVRASLGKKNVEDIVDQNSADSGMVR